MKHFIEYTIILLATFTSIYGLAQTTAPPVIDLPTGGGTMIGDIIHANKKIFTYGADGISVYDATNNSFISKIPFDNTGIFFGKFNPVYPGAGLAAPNQNLMVHNPNNQCIYVIAPKLKILVIKTDLTQTWTAQLPVDDNGNPTFLDNILDTQSEAVTLKYDNTNNRLYMQIASCYPSTDSDDIGNFHEQRSLFGIYSVDINTTPDAPNHFTILYNEVRV